MNLDFRSKRVPNPFFDAGSNTASNMDAWKLGISCAKSGDAQGMLKALLEARGTALSLSARGKPARNPCSKAILALRENPLAWARLREINSIRRNEEEEAGAPPYAVSMLEYCWAANPAALAGAAKLWRESLPDNKQSWWPSPFLRQPYEGPLELAATLRRAAARHFKPSDYRLGALSGPEPVNPANNDPAERAALSELLIEVSRGCIEDLWRSEAREGQARLDGGKIWARGSSNWGLGWFGAQVSLEGDPDATGGKVTPARVAAQRMMQEGLASGAAEAGLACRKIALGTQSASVVERLGPAALRAWSAAYPDAPEGLPFEAQDWMAPHALLSLCVAAGVSDASLGRWLAGAGALWSAPATFASGGQVLRASYPVWSYQHRGEESSAPGLGAWTPLEWALLSHPRAARDACVLGAKLAPGVEAALLQGAQKGPEAKDCADAHVWAEACRVAESSMAPSAPKARRLSAL